MMKNRAIVMLALSALLLLLPHAALGKDAVKVNGAVLTEADVDEAVQRLVPAASFHGGLSPEKKQLYREKAIDDIVDKELLYQEAKKRGMKVDKESIKAVKEATIKRLGGKKQFKDALKRADTSEKQYEAKVEKNFLVERFTEDEITKKAAVTDAEVKEYYEANKSSYKRPEARRIRHMLISVKPEASAEERERRRKRAEEALEKARKGEDFSLLAWDYSDDPYRVKGGDLGLQHKGRLDPGLEEVIYGLNIGELSGVIETIYGYHIVRVDEIKEPEQLDFDDVAQGIKRQLTEKRTKELKETLMGRLRAEARIEVY